MEPEETTLVERQECPKDGTAPQGDTVWCLPCASTGESQPAARYCIDCDELLCHTCVSFHMKFKSTKGHKLVTCNKEDIFKGAQLLSPHLFCPNHNDRPIEVKCDIHDSLCCFTCATIIHKNCSSVYEIRQTAGGCKTNGSVDELRHRIGEVNTCIEEIISINDDCKKDFEESVQEIPKSLKELKSNLMKLFEKIEEAVLLEVQRLHLDQTLTAGNREETWKCKLNANDDLIKMLDTIQEVGNDSQIYVICHKIEEKIAEIETTLKDQGGLIKGKKVHITINEKLNNIIKTENTRSLVFVDNIQNLHQLFKTSEYLGKNFMKKRKLVQILYQTASLKKRLSNVNKTTLPKPRLMSEQSRKLTLLVVWQKA